MCGNRLNSVAHSIYHNQCIYCQVLSVVPLRLSCNFVATFSLFRDVHHPNSVGQFPLPLPGNTVLTLLVAFLKGGPGIFEEKKKHLYSQVTISLLFCINLYHHINSWKVCGPIVGTFNSTDDYGCWIGPGIASSGEQS